MKIGVLGTGIVGQTMATRLAGLDHDVMVGTSDPASALGRTEPDRYGNPPFPAWREQHPEIGLGTFAEAAARGDLVVNATFGATSVETLQAAGAEHLEGKVLLDIANPLDFSQGVPPSLTVCNTDSLGEQIQRAFPAARVVKALNTMNALLMVDPSQLAAGDHTVFVSGNDAEAKATATGLLRSFGWSDILDLGDITTARGSEMILPIWVRLFGVLGQPIYQFKVVR